MINVCSDYSVTIMYIMKIVMVVPLSNYVGDRNIRELRLFEYNRV